MWKNLRRQFGRYKASREKVRRQRRVVLQTRNKYAAITERDRQKNLGLAAQISENGQHEYTVYVLS